MHIRITPKYIKQKIFYSKWIKKNKQEDNINNRLCKIIKK